MIFIVAKHASCVAKIAEREGVPFRGAERLTSLTMHKIRGLEEPKIWIADCGLDMLTDTDKDMIISRRSHLTRVTCS